MNIVWTEHAALRARQRDGVAWSPFRALVERSIEAHEWEEWFEWDNRDDRGLQTNLIVRAPDTAEDDARRGLSRRAAQLKHSPFDVLRKRST